MTVSSPTLDTSPYSIEPLLSNRLFLAPQLAGDRLYFLSNLSGHFSLYAMQPEGSIPEPLLPPGIALQNPELQQGLPFFVFPELGRIVVSIDHDGDENYQPMAIPLEGGQPHPLFGDRFARYRVRLVRAYPEDNRLYLSAESRDEARFESWTVTLPDGELVKLGESMFGSFVQGVSDDRSRVLLIDTYGIGDVVIYMWEQERGERRLFYGTPMEQRTGPLPPNETASFHFVRGGRGLLAASLLFDDAYGLVYLDVESPQNPRPVPITGIMHTGTGELTALSHLDGNRYRIDYNIDGASWVYEGVFDEEGLVMRLERVLVGTGALSNGTLEGLQYDHDSDRYALSFSTATSPTQLYTLEGPERTLRQVTAERILGLSSGLLSPGEDDSFISHDGLRVSARLYLPSAELGYEAPYPLIYYIHGGPQSQERPNFAWFSMPLIQFLTLQGFAVFVPNVRGSTGQGFSYMKAVDRDWGGKDRLDHVHAMTHVLPRDPRIDVRRAGVIGRSYGGYMALALASRHPELWGAAVDMFGPYDLTTFAARVPEAWKPFIRLTMGDPETERDFLAERSPITYLDAVSCPLFVIQGKNDPRVVEEESARLVADLRARGKDVAYLMFENEGHDVLKHENKVRCYTAITDFFRAHLQEGTTSQ
jgi:pimeloyl-ACP methyl ester carboxylesterase